MRTISKVLLASAACGAFLAGCATNEQGQLVIDPNKVNAAISVALAPPPPPPPVVIEEAYQSMPTDAYVAVVAERDVVFVGGDTFIWVVGPNSVRHRQFYAHGDHRADVFHRRDELHRVMANHDGHLPDHAIAAHAPPGHPGVPPVAAQGFAKPGAMPAAHAAAPGKPAPAAKTTSKDNKPS